MKDFLLIGITLPDEVKDESKKIVDYLSSGTVDIIHLRKPSWSKDKFSRLIEKIPAEFHARLKIHDCFELLNRFDLRGVHLNSRNPVAPGENCLISKSAHSIEELNDYNKYEYITLSPIFDSISKQGYKGNFIPEQLADVLKGKRIIALGGVTPDSFSRLKENNFYGAAMSGSLWN